MDVHPDFTPVYAPNSITYMDLLNETHEARMNWYNADDQTPRLQSYPALSWLQEQERAANDRGADDEADEEDLAF